MQDKKKEAGRQMRFTEIEMQLLQATFKDNELLVKLLRKLFLPELDAYAPLGQNIDLWMTVDIKDPEQSLINLRARNELITHIENRLLELNTLANLSNESDDELKVRAKRDSSK